MGSAFSPKLANVFMSVILRSFLRTQVLHPLLMKHFIDDLIFLWPGNRPLSQPWTISTQTFDSLFKSSPISIDYLDLTIFKGEQFQTSQQLDLKAFQKPWINISTYNSVEYTSYLHQSVFKGFTTRECITYSVCEDKHLKKTTTSSKSKPSSNV